MLEIIPKKRITAKEALCHPCFSKVTINNKKLTKVRSQEDFPKEEKTIDNKLRDKKVRKNSPVAKYESQRLPKRRLSPSNVGSKYLLSESGSSEATRITSKETTNNIQLKFPNYNKEAELVIEKNGKYKSRSSIRKYDQDEHKDSEFPKLKKGSNNSTTYKHHHYSEQERLKVYYVCNFSLL